jgi:hypothetical protein
MLDHLSMAWELRWKFCPDRAPKSNVGTEEFSLVPAVPKRNQVLTLSLSYIDMKTILLILEFPGCLIISLPFFLQLELLSKEWNFILCQTERNLDLFEPFLAFRRGLLKILGSEEHLIEHLFQSASALRKVGSLLYFPTMGPLFVFVCLVHHDYFLDSGIKVFFGCGFLI